MGNVVPFTPKAEAGGGWTAAERARLAELADRLAAAGVKVEVVYGVSDDGDPWCVIKDEDEEVLIHVARIGGQFVIHDAAEDAIRQGDTLWDACDRLLGPDWRDPREPVVVAFSHRQAQSVIALALAASFIHEVENAEAAVDADPAPAAAQPAEPASALLMAAHAAAPDRPELLIDRSAGGEDRSAAAPAETPGVRFQAEVRMAAAPSELIAGDGLKVDAAASARPPAARDEPRVLRGGAGDDRLEGGDSDDLIFGEAGDDSLYGAGGSDSLYGGSGADTLDGGTAAPGGFDFLDGGEGDDLIHLAGRVVARGGEGADGFVLHAGAPDGLLGLILDFAADQGDRLVFPSGREVNIVGVTQVADVTAGFRGFGGPLVQATSGFDVAVDLNGDGVADGHVLIAGDRGPLGAAPKEPGPAPRDDMIRPEPPPTDDGGFLLG